MARRGSIKRLLSERPLDWPEAHLRLIDALREYIRSDEAIGRDLLREGSITREQFDNGTILTDPMRLMLVKLERFEMDPTLHGLERLKR